MQLSPECGRWRLVAANRDRPLTQRVEALEDILDAAVGDTALVRAGALQGIAELGQVYLKLETRNPTGNHLIRVAGAHVLDALRRGYDGVSVAARQRTGEAFAFAAWLCGLRCAIHIAADAQVRTTEAMTGRGAAVLRVPGSSDAAIAVSRDLARQENLYDANPSPTNSALEMSAYGQIANEIYDQLRDAPAAIAMPSTPGALTAGIKRGFDRLTRRNKASRIPRILAGAAERGHEPRDDGAISLAVDGDPTTCTVGVTVAAMTAWSRQLRGQESIETSPAATAGLAALIAGREPAALLPDRYVVILTEA